MPRRRRVGDGVSRACAPAGRARALRAAPRVLRRLQHLPRPDARDDRRDRPARARCAAGRAGGAVAGGVPRMAPGVIAYKFLDDGAVGPFTGFRWPVGEWVDSGGVEPCLEGIHACGVRDLPVWLGRELWEIELDGTLVEQERKLVASRARLTRRIDAWDRHAAREFGRFCARRTRERVGYVPVLAGFVGDVERFVAEDRIPIAGFASARAAELRDGSAAYAEERLAQATWLAERLGLEGALATPDHRDPGGRG